MHRFLLIPVLLVTLSGVAAENARVWVQFTPGQKAAVLSQVQAVGGTVHYQFDDLQAIAVTVPEAALQGLSRNPNVTLVEEDPVRALFAHQSGQTTPYGVNMVLQSDLWTPPASGVKVGVIDSGVFGHVDFSGQSISGSDDLKGAGPWYQDGSGHGTHVTGTILAANNSVGVIGVAPAASVYMVRVFGDSGSWAYSSTLVAAVSNAVFAGSRIISMSLGGSFKSLTEQSAFDKYYNQGILLIAAAGNDGTSRMSYPASYSSVISVGAVDQNKSWADFSQFNSQVELAAPGVGVLSTVPYVDEATVTAGGTTFHGSHIENAVRGSASGVIVNGGQALSSDANAGWIGKVVLVERGTISFYEKVLNVQNNGGAAVVIYNNAPGAFSGTLGDGNSSTIPAIAISREDGLALLGKVGQSATVSSAFTALASGYAYFDGTSMSTPHVSGVAALLWGAFPNKSNVEIRSALQNTAEDLGTAGRDNYYGYGLVRAKAAYDALAGSSGGGGTEDTTAPVISKLSAVKAGKKYNIAWTTDEPAKSTVTIGNKIYTGTTYATSHSFSVTGRSGTSYTVTSTDAANNKATATGTLP